MRLAKSFSIDSEISKYVDETKGDCSASDRVNQLLSRAIVQEQYDRIEAEAQAFFADDKLDRSGTETLQKAALRTLRGD